MGIRLSYERRTGSGFLKELTMASRTCYRVARFCGRRHREPPRGREKSRCQLGAVHTWHWAAEQGCPFSRIALEGKRTPQTT